MSLKAAAAAGWAEAGAAAGFAGCAAARSPDLSEPWTPEPLPAQKARISNAQEQGANGGN